MSLNILVIKTGSTIQSLQKKGMDFEDWFTSAMGLSVNDVSICDPTQGEALPSLVGVSGIVVTGSPAYITDEADWNFIVADYCRSAIENRKPILGVCYGHQLLAWAFAGSVGFNPNGREIGSTEVQLTQAAENDPLFSGLPRQLVVQVSHLQSVLRLPENAVLLASNQMDTNHAFRLGELAWGVQFHPEFTAEITKAYILERADAIRQEGIDTDSLLAELRDSSSSTGLLLRFVEIVKQSQTST